MDDTKITQATPGKQFLDKEFKDNLKTVFVDALFTAFGSFLKAIGEAMTRK